MMSILPVAVAAEELPGEAASQEPETVESVSGYKELSKVLAPEEEDSFGSIPKRLIVDKILTGDNTLGASRVYYNTQDHETILEFDTREETSSAYRTACSRWGEENCFVDEVVSFDQIGMSTDSTQPPSPSRCKSWGSRYMKMNQLKTQAAYYGYTKQVTVAVIDSGVSRVNPLFAEGRLLEGGWNFRTGSPNIIDDVGHGSHVAGIIADATPANVKLLVLKVTDSQGRASLYVIKNALRYAIKKRVQVINLSLGVTGKKAAKYTYLDKIIKKAYNLKIPICVSAGNNGMDVKYSYPANRKIPLTVSAINSNGRRGSYIDVDSQKKFYYSNYGSSIDFAAPGTDILSAGPGTDYWTLYRMTGTSMAVPHISAAVAYLKMRNPGMSCKMVENQLKGMSKDLGTKGKDKYFGWGCPIMGNFFTGKTRKSEKSKIGRTSISHLVNTEKGIKISWKKAGKADSYKIYRRSGKGKYKLLAKVSSGLTSYVDQNTSSGRKYIYTVKAFGKNGSGEKSTAKEIIRLETISNIRVKLISKCRLSLSWKKIKGVSGYEIRYSASKAMKAKKTVTAKKTKKQIADLRGRYCFYQIRACRKAGGKSYYSAWSGINKARLR